MTEAAATAQAEGTAPQAGTKGRGGKNGTKTKTSPIKGRAMTDEHKRSLALGREQGRIVSNYLEALEAHRPKRGRRVSREELEQRLKKIKEEVIPNTTGLDHLQAIQDRNNLENRLAVADEDTGELVKDLQAEFVKVAKDYAQRKGFTASAFREAGVPVAVLKEAGLVGRKSA